MPNLNQSSSDQNKLSNDNVWWHPVFAGWASGTVGGYSCFLFEALKKKKSSDQDNPFKDKKLTIIQKIKASYIGVHSFALTLAPVSMVQVSMNNFLTNKFASAKEERKFAIGILSGSLGAFVSAPVEHIILTMQLESKRREEAKAQNKINQDTKCTMREAASMLQKKGNFYAWTGLKPLLCREAIFGSTMLVGADAGGEWLSTYLKRDVNVIGQIGVGLLGAFISHPFDVIATRKQMIHPPVSMRKSIQLHYQEKGVKGFWLGYAYRAFLFTGCMAIIGKLEKYIQLKLKEAPPILHGYKSIQSENRSDNVLQAVKKVSNKPN